MVMGSRVRSSLVPLFALASLLALPAPGPADATARTTGRVDWPTYRFDPAHTGANPYEQTIGPSNVASLVKRWSFRETNTVSVAVAGGLLYLYGKDALFALHQKTGSVAWSVPMPGGYDVPAVADGHLFLVPGDLVTIESRDAQTGDVAWTSPLDDISFASSPTVSDGRVFVDDRDGTVYAFDESTGERLWSKPTVGSTQGSPTVSGGVVFVGAARPGGTAGFTKGGLFAFDAATGHRLWAYRFQEGVSASTPAVAEGLVYVASGTGTLLARHVSDGSFAWKARMGTVSWCSPAVADGLVFAAAGDGALQAFDAATGSSAWTAPTGASTFTSGPSVANGVVYIVGMNGVIHAFDEADGTELWHHQLVGYGQSVPSPVVVDGYVYVGSDSKMYAFSLPR